MATTLKAALDELRRQFISAPEAAPERTSADVVGDLLAALAVSERRGDDYPAARVRIRSPELAFLVYRGLVPLGGQGRGIGVGIHYPATPGNEGPDYVVGISKKPSFGDA